jgi:PfaB family protein
MSAASAQNGFRDHPIAIVGMGGLFPQAPTLDAFLNLILSATDTSREVSPQRWAADPERICTAELKEDRPFHSRGCYIDDFAFDPSGLDLPTELLNTLDPTFQFVLHASRAALNDGRIETVDRRRIGVVLAAIALPTDSTSALTRETLGRAFERELLGENLAGTSQIEGHTHPINHRAVGLSAGVVCAGLGLGGGSFTLDAACASSLYAIKFACDELQAHRADAMLAGGVNRPDCLYTQTGFTQLRALSRSGRCRPFDAGADGLMVGEGAGAVLLKRLGDAIRDGDRIYSVIRGIGLSNDVAGSLLAADSEGQLRAMRQAYEQSGWSPADVDVIECHGTGTPLGDAVEFGSLCELWSRDKWLTGQCVLGSVKSNVGHLLTGAGIAGLLKTVLAMNAKTLPPSANFEQPSPKLNIKESPFQVISKPTPWETRDANTPRRAAISAFGFGGINAHLLLEEFSESQSQVARKSPPTKRAPEKSNACIVGMSAHFGAIAGIDEFESAIFSGTTAVAKRSENRWRGAVDATNSLNKISGAFIDQVSVPIGEFKVPPAEIRESLPQQMLMLKVVAEALDDAGISRNALGPRFGCIIGMSLDANASNYHLRWAIPELARGWAATLGLQLTEDDHGAGDHDAWVRDLQNEASPPLTSGRVVGSLGGMVASRIAREFGIGGPSLTMSADDNSGLRALELGARMLERGELDGVVVGAVDLPCDVRRVLGDRGIYVEQEFVNPLDANSKGTSPGDGAVAVVLKRSSDATNDRRYAELRGFGFAGGSAPGQISTDAYCEALDRAYRDGDVERDSVGMIEAAGAGRPEFDALESEALGAFFDKGERKCALGAAVPTIGFAHAASGLASVASAALCLHRQTIAPLPEFSQANGSLSKSNQFYVARECQPWLRDRLEGPRRAGVSGISFHGECAHVILEEADAAPVRATYRKPSELEATVFRVAGKGVADLCGQFDELIDAIEKHSTGIARLGKIWHESNKHKQAADKIVTIVSGDLESLRASIASTKTRIQNAPAQPINGDLGAYYVPEPIRGGQLALVYPGSGVHQIGMGRQLLLDWPNVSQRLDSTFNQLADQFLPQWVMPRRLDYSGAWKRNAHAELSSDTRRTIMSQVSYGSLVTEILRDAGIRPDSAIGYSLGETTSLIALGVWPDRDGMAARLMKSPLFATELAGPCKAASRRWKLTKGDSVSWAVCAINQPVDRVRKALAKFDRAYLLIVNAPGECVVGGQREQVERLMATLGCEGVELSGASAVHCPVVQEVVDQYRELHLLETTVPAGIRFYSAAWARSYEVTRQSAADSITAQATDGFDFAKLIEKAYDEGVRYFVEVGPQATCTRMIRSILGERPYFAVSASGQAGDERTPLMHAIAALVAHRVVANLDGIYQNAGTPSLGKRSSDRPTVTITTGGPAFNPPKPIRSKVALPVTLSVDAPIPDSGKSQGAPQPGRAIDPPKTPASIAPAIASNESVEHAHALVEGAIQNQLIATMEAANKATSDAHDTFLRFSQTAMTDLAEALTTRQQLLSQMSGSVAIPSGVAPSGVARDEPIAHRVAGPVPVAFDRDKCMEFAIGKAANVLGPDFAEVDQYPVRVRLPDEPLMLVDRILEIEGVRRSLGGGRVVTEKDVVAGDWYLDGGRMPISITVESGQADLFLCSYLGIDHAVKGTRAYRLLDATVRFHRGLPVPGEVIRYDIRIDRFVQQGETYLFFFSFEGTIAGQPLLSMSGGCAGFFTENEIRGSGGIVETAEERANKPGVPLDGLDQLVPSSGVESYDERQVDALRSGDLAACFGDSFANLPLSQPIRLPSDKMRLVHRVTEMNIGGGRFGKGLIRAEADIHPDDWFLTCHFVDDMVMPGTLMYDCCVQTLRIFLMRIGWVAEHDSVCYEPVVGVSSALRCRGPVTRATKVVAYELHIKEMGYGPQPYVIADALMYGDGEKIVRFVDMSLKMTGTTQNQLTELWSGSNSAVCREPTVNRDQTGEANQIEITPIGEIAVSPMPKAPIYDHDRILAFAIGDPSKAFGDRYQVFDQQRCIARLPGPPFQFLDRVTEVHAEPWELNSSGWIECQYDVPPNAWYFGANRQRSMPFAVLVEIALQPCGWLAAYKGSALASDQDLKFRNLDGDATLYREVFQDAGTLTVRARMTQVSKAGGMLIQKFDMQMWQGPQIVYAGDTVFGFFTSNALARQTGISNPANKYHQPSDAERARSIPIPWEPCAPWKPEEDAEFPSTGAMLPGRAFQMVDRIDLFVPDGGSQGLGFIRGSKDVDPDEWYFAAHFYQDPVCPGSLGLESMLQLLKIVAIERFGSDIVSKCHFTPNVVGARHTWSYRGQIIPDNRKVEVCADVTSIDFGSKIDNGSGSSPSIRAKGWLSVDGTAIYEMGDFGISLVPDGLT